MAGDKSKTSYGNSDSMSAKKPNKRFQDKRVEHVSVETKNVEKAYDDLYKAFSSMADKQVRYYSKSTKGMADMTITTQSRVYDQLTKMHSVYTERYVASESIAAKRVVANSLSSHNMMYDHLERMHSDYLDTYIKNEAIAAKRVADIWSGVSRNTTGGFSRSANSDSYNASLSNMFDEIESQSKSLSSTIDDLSSSIFDAMKSIDSSLKTKVNKYTTSNRSSIDDSLEEIAEGSRDAISKLESVDSVLGSIKNAVLSIANTFVQDFTDGIYKYFNAYESTFTSLATRMDMNYSDTRAYYSDMKDTISGDMQSVINISDNLIPAMQKVAEQGLMGETAKAKAYGDALSSVLMPWLDTTSEQFVNMSVNMSQNSINQLKGQQLLLQTTQAGNRLLQNGVINSMTSELAPLLTSIDFNTGGASHLTGEYAAIMTELTTSLDKGGAGLSENEAYSIVKDLMSIQKDQYSALTSGDFSKISVASGLIDGKSIGDAYADMQSIVRGLARSTNTDVGSSAVANALGGSFAMGTDWYTQDILRSGLGAVNKGDIDKHRSEYQNEAKAIHAIEDMINNADEKLTSTQRYVNMANNATADSIGADIITHLSHGDKILEAICAMVGSIATYLIGNGIVKSLTGGRSVTDLLGKFLGRGSNLATSVDDIGRTTKNIFSGNMGSVASKAGIGALSTAGIAMGGYAVGDTIKRLNEKDHSMVSAGEQAANNVALVAGSGAVATGGVGLGIATGLITATGPVGWIVGAVALALGGVAVAANAVAKQLDETSAITKAIHAEYKTQVDTMAEVNKNLKKQLKDTVDEINNMANTNDKKARLVQEGILTEQEVSTMTSAGIEEFLKDYEKDQKDFLKAKKAIDESSLKAISKEQEKQAQATVDKNTEALGKQLNVMTEASDGFSQEVYDILKDMGASDHALKKYKQGKWTAEGVLNGEGGGVGFLGLNTQKDLAAKMTDEDWATIMNRDSLKGAGMEEISKVSAQQASTTVDGVLAMLEKVGPNNQSVIDFLKANGASKKAIEKYISGEWTASGIIAGKGGGIGAINTQKDLNKNISYDEWTKLSGDLSVLLGEVNANSYASGIAYVPHDQVAKIHKGEAVLTAEENKLYRSMRESDGMGSKISKLFDSFGSRNRSDDRTDKRSADSDAIVSALKEVSSEIIKAIRETSTSNYNTNSNTLPKASTSYNPSIVSLASVL